MLKRLTFLFFILALTSAKGQTTRKLYQNDLMRGKVMQLIETQFTLTDKNNGSVKADTTLLSIFMYDVNKKTTDLTEDTPVWREGKKVLKVRRRYNYKYYTDSNGDQFVAAYRDSIKRSDTKIDTLGRITSATYYDEKGRPDATLIMSYQTDLATNANYFDKKGNHTSLIKATRTPDERLVQTEVYNKRDQLTLTFRYHYYDTDGKGNWL